MQDAPIELQLIELRKEMARLKEAYPQFRELVHACHDEQDKEMTILKNDITEVRVRMSVWGAAALILLSLASGVIGWHINQPYHAGMVPHVEAVKKEVMVELKEMDTMVSANTVAIPALLTRMDGMSKQIDRVDDKLDLLLQKTH
uniref:Uncharacterized protein n=1 Tax=viral metagenome TaxID=1070528 RepID=A0A6H1ZIX2_9ZZZZ